MRILVTGGAGFIGHFVTKKLLEKGHEVTVLDNLSYGTAGIEALIQNPNLTFIRGDIGELKALCKAVKGNEVVIALAAIVGDPACGIDEDETFRSNYLATHALLDVSEHFGVKRLVFASSCSVYGDTGDDLAQETYPLNPLSLYAKTRVMSENLLIDKANSLEVVILRLATVFGVSERMRFDLVVNTLSLAAKTQGMVKVHGNGLQWRPNVHVQDAAEAFILAGFAPKRFVDHQIINIGDESNTLTIVDLAQKVKEVFPQTEIKHQNLLVDARNYRVSFEKMRNALKFSPKISLLSGILELKTFLETEVTNNYQDEIYYNVRYLQPQILQSEERLCFIAPFKNAENLILPFIKEIERFSLYTPITLSIVFIDDGSTDHSLEILREVKKGTNLRMSIVSLTREYGLDAAIHAGIRHAHVADYYATLNLDLLYKPETILDMVRILKEREVELVYGLRGDIRVGNGFIDHLYWYILMMLSSIPMPKDQSPIRVFSRSFVERFVRRTDNPEFIPAAFGRLKSIIEYYPLRSYKVERPGYIEWMKNQLNFVIFSLRSSVLGLNKHLPYTIKQILE